MSAVRLYVIRIDISEAATNYAFALVTHAIRGRTRAEAAHNVESHMRSDAFLRAAMEGREYKGVVTRVRVREGWSR